jgi:hypothetical protein
MHMVASPTREAAWAPQQQIPLFLADLKHSVTGPSSGLKPQPLRWYIHPQGWAWIRYWSGLCFMLAAKLTLGCMCSGC